MVSECECVGLCAVERVKEKVNTRNGERERARVRVRVRKNEKVQLIKNRKGKSPLFNISSALSRPYLAQKIRKRFLVFYFTLEPFLKNGSSPSHTRI